MENQELIEYACYLRDKSLAELADIKRSIDRDTYPEKYELILREIEIKENMKTEGRSSNTVIKNITYIWGEGSLRKGDIVWIGMKLLGLYLVMLSIVNLVSFFTFGVISQTNLLGVGLELTRWMLQSIMDSNLPAFWFVMTKFVLYLIFGYYFLFHGKFIIEKAFPHYFKEKEEDKEPAEEEK